MAEEDRVDISEEVNPPVSTHSQPPPAHAPPPPTPAGILPAYSGVPPTHLPPPTSSRAPLPPVSLTSSASDDQARIAALEGTVNQMAANMAELLALLKGPNRASSSSTPSPGQGPIVDPTPWVPPTQARRTWMHPRQRCTRPRFTLSPAHFRHRRPPRSMPRPHLRPSPYRPHLRSMPCLRRWFSRRPVHLLQLISKPWSFFPTERRLKRMEETIRALQASDARPDARYGDCSPFPGMRLPPKFRIPEFKTYEGTTDPRHHLRHYRGKMLQYWEYEEFVIHSFQDSLSGSALDWFMSLKAEDIP
ncbi:hypothetical protein CRG98_050102, partial [Punica granatum]